MLQLAKELFLAIAQFLVMSKSKGKYSMIDWAEKRPLWEKLIWYSILKNGNTTPEDIEDTFFVFLIENKLDHLDEELFELQLDGLTPPETKTLQKIKLKEVRDCENINAIPNNQVLKFGEYLTIIYGINGAGKSGFGKLLANACYARGIRKILPNLKNNSVGELIPKAKFVLDDDRTIDYAPDQADIDDLKRFAVFDNKCVPIYLDNSNNLNFTPGQLLTFDRVIEQIGIVEARFEQEKQKRIVSNPIINLFNNEPHSNISTFFLNTTFKTTDKEIEEFSKFEKSDEELLKQLKTNRDIKSKLDISKIKKQLSDEVNALKRFVHLLNKLFEYSKQDYIDNLNNAIGVVKEKRNLVKEVGIQNFKNDNLKSIGSEKWKAFLITAQELYEYERKDYDNEIDYCLLCQQSLGENEKSLFEAYWKFLESTAETELKLAQKKLNELKAEIQAKLQSYPILDDSNYPIKVLNLNNPEIVQDLSGLLNNHTSFLDSLLKKINDLNELKSDLSFTYNFDKILKVIKDKEDKDSKLIDPSIEIKKLDYIILELTHRKKVNPFVVELKKYVEYLRWIQEAVKVKFPKNAYTIARRKLFDEIIAQDYSEIFNTESTKLNGAFGLKINTRGADRDTVLEVSLGFAKGNKLTDVLSEGEQKVSAIADFLTEIQIDENNCGIILDDPVTSLDHSRKEKIAKRLVEESQNRQVIVFTHDITFFLALQYYSEKLNSEMYISTIRKSGDIPGIIDDKLPWVAQNVKARAGVLKDRLVELEKMIRTNANDEDVEIKIKSWYELLRESWERAVEERLLKGTIERFAPAIQTQRIKRIEITSELLSEIELGMTESSKWVHDRASGLNIPIPDIQEITSHLDRFENFIKVCKP